MHALRGLRLLTALTLCALIARTGLAQTTWYVDAAGTPPGTGAQGDPYTSIQFALSQATTVDGDTVLVAPGTYAETVDFLGKAVTVESSQGAAATTLDAQGAGSAVSFTAASPGAAVLRGFTVTGGTGAPMGSTTAGGGLLCTAAGLTVDQCVLRQNVADLGGGLYAAAAVDVLDSVVEDNVAGSSAVLRNGLGGGFFVAGGGDLVFVGDLDRNQADKGGGGYVDAGGRLAMTGNCRDNVGTGFSGPPEGGGLYLGGDAAILTDVHVTGNLADGLDALGGGIFGVVTMQGGSVVGNGAGEFFSTGSTPGRGGGIYGTATVDGTLIEGNFGGIQGGNVRGDGLYTNCTVRTGASQFGGGFYCPIGASLVIRDSLLEDNQALSDGTEDFGGGVYGPALLERCVLRGNRAFGDGGGAHGATLVDCVLEMNTASPPDVLLDARGAGAYQCTLQNCRVSGNVASSFPGSNPGEGGGLFDCDATGCEVLDNRADVGAGARLGTLTSCTLTRNVAATSGDGVDSATVTNSILWNNGDELGAGSSATWSDVQGGAPGAGNIDQDPLFWCEELDDFFLRAGSPCIGAGSLAGMPADMGANPFDAAHEIEPVAYCSAKVNSAGCLPFLQASGNPSATATQTFHIDALDVLPSQPGLMLYGFGRADLGYHGGTLCIRPPVRRALPALMPQATGTPPCSGRLRLEFNVRIQTPTDPLLTVGQRVTAQWRQLDPADPAGFGDSLSDALLFYVCP